MANWGFLFFFSAVISWVQPIQGYSHPHIGSVPDSNVIRSPTNDNISVDYKLLPSGVCATTFATQKQYTGYVHLPPSTIAPIQQDYPINTFFWFVEARESPETAPLTIYLNGGPGSSGLVGLFSEVGPCEVVESSKDRLSTRAREWSWDRSSNILFIDQPVHSGFSYDSLTSGSLDLLTSSPVVPPTTVPPGQPDYTFVNGTFSTSNPNATANTTEIAAESTWHMLQAFLKEFPQYNPGEVSQGEKRDKAGVHLFTESYGGRYGPAFATHWEKKNEQRENGELSKADVLKIELRSVGILQGCIDHLVQDPFYPIFAHNNTYGIEALSSEEKDASLKAFYKPNGCRDLIQACREAGESKDPKGNGDVEEVNQLCIGALATCNQDVISPYENSNRRTYDISQSTLVPFPPALHLEYLNTASVQSAIGVPLNFTVESSTVKDAFISTGDHMRGASIPQLAELLGRGIRVALIYGDRDYTCNWLGGEAASFSIAASASPSYTHSFNAAGYTPLLVNSTYTGGAVRQYGNLSFTRVYDAGHLTAAYQPETLYQLFNRVISGKDVSTGEEADLSNFSTQGHANATATNEIPPIIEPTCYLRNIDWTCSPEQVKMLKEGKGVIINGIWYASEEDWHGPSI